MDEGEHRSVKPCRHVPENDGNLPALVIGVVVVGGEYRACAKVWTDVVGVVAGSAIVICHEPMGLMLFAVFRSAMIFFGKFCSASVYAVFFAVRTECTDICEVIVIAVRFLVEFGCNGMRPVECKYGFVFVRSWTCAIVAIAGPEVKVSFVFAGFLVCKYNGFTRQYVECAGAIFFCTSLTRRVLLPL